MRRYLALLVICAAAALLLATNARSGDLSTSKHNLSVTGPGTVTASSESRLCVFCHTPHNANPAQPLWNHATSAEVYDTYESTTLDATTPLDQPTGSSKLCLSCHDGTIALGQTVNDGLIAMLGAAADGSMPAGSSDLGIDLTDDHPISFSRQPADAETVDPPPGDAVKLDASGRIECTACHDPHVEDIDPVTLRFLVKDNRGSALCVTCHEVDFWSAATTAHRTSTATYTATEGAHTGYSNVADNGCESCHRPHSGNEPQRLVKYVEELTCEACHDGSVAQFDIASEFTKATSHPTYSTTPSVHDASESPTSPSFPLPETDPGTARHAECADCHNPHAAYQAAASAPDVTGPLTGVSGIDSAGVAVDPASFEYEVCYKCHADSANKPQPLGTPNPPYINRQIEQFNVRLEFDPANPSHHAVEAPGRNSDVPSLLPPWTTNSIVRCTDCHANDSGPGAGGSGPAGPHGSAFNHLLERNLEIGANNSGSNFGQMYAMCFKCHDENSIMNDESFDDHKRHIDNEDSSCLVCHDPHGVSATQGNATENSHLINFDLSVVEPSSSGELRFEDRGFRSGACFLRCHNNNHNPRDY